MVTWDVVRVVVPSRVVVDREVWACRAVRLVVTRDASMVHAVLAECLSQEISFPHGCTTGAMHTRGTAHFEGRIRHGIAFAVVDHSRGGYGNGGAGGVGR